MFPHEGPSGHAGKAVSRQQLRQLHQCVIVIAVAEQHHRHRQSTLAVHHIPQVRHQQIWNAPSVGGTTHYGHITGRNGQLLSACGRQRVVIHFAVCAQRFCQTVGDAIDCFLRGAGPAEVQRPYFFNSHAIFLSLHGQPAAAYCAYS